MAGSGSNNKKNTLTRSIRLKPATDMGYRKIVEIFGETPDNRIGFPLIKIPVSLPVMNRFPVNLRCECIEF